MCWESHATLMAINFDHKILNTPKRGPIIKTILEKADALSKKHGVEVHYSGLPFIRTAVSQLVSREFVLFLQTQFWFLQLFYSYFSENYIRFFSRSSW